MSLSDLLELWLLWSKMKTSGSSLHIVSHVTNHYSSPQVPCTGGNFSDSFDTSAPASIQFQNPLEYL